MICPKCKATIDDDSLFCDQCGNEINVCPTCGKAGRGKICTVDGTKLVPAKARKKEFTPTVEKLAVHSTATPSQDAFSIPPPPKAHPDSSGKLKLINKSIGKELEPRSGDILGRKEGPFAPVFATHQQVSGKHARVSFDTAKGWSITDLGSTNGTKYNGTRLAPHVAQPLVDQSFLMIANIEFHVRIEMQPDPTRTMLAE